MDAFDFQDKVMDLLIKDETFCTLMDIPYPEPDPNVVSDDEYQAYNDKVNQRVKRQIYSTDVLQQDSIPVVIEYFYNAYQTNNFLMNHGAFQIDVYTYERYQAVQIVRAIKRVVQDNFEDMYLFHENQTSSGIEGVYEYSLRFLPLISS